MIVAIVANTTKEGVRTIVPPFIDDLERLGFTVRLDNQLRQLIEDKPVPISLPDDTFFADADYIVAFGGDGTILHTARRTEGSGIPILGVNLGKVGFLAEISPATLGDAAQRLRDGSFEIQERMAFRAVTNTGGVYFALNDVVLDRSADTRIIEYTVSVEHVHAGDFAADGIIVSTPTGSTAHSVSAGGPLVTPECSVTILTPICPHSLTIRPMVIDGARPLHISIQRGQARMAVDGQSFVTVPEGGSLTIARAPMPVRIIHFPENTYFSTLHTRLNWGVSPKLRNA